MFKNNTNNIMEDDKEITRFQNNYEMYLLILIFIFRSKNNEYTIGLLCFFIVFGLSLGRLFA